MIKQESAITLSTIELQAISVLHRTILEVVGNFEAGDKIPKINWGHTLYEYNKVKRTNITAKQLLHASWTAWDTWEKDPILNELYANITLGVIEHFWPEQLSS